MNSDRHGLFATKRRNGFFSLPLEKAGGNSVRPILFEQACKNTTCSPARLPFQFNHGCTRMNTDSIAAKERKERKRSASASMLFSASAGEKVAVGRMR
jgi:hypothetical protein